MEFDQLETYKLELGEPGEPLVNEYPLGPGVVHELIQDRVVKRYPGDGTTEECVSLELTGTKRKLKLPVEVEVPHLFSSRENALSFLSLGKLEGLPHNVVTEICADDNGNLWLASEGGITKYDGRKLYNYSVSQGLSSNSNLSIFHDSRNRIWIGSLKNGIDIIDGETLTHYGKSEGFVDETILAIMEDRQGNIWIGTDGYSFGLWKYDGRRFTQFKPNNGCPINRVEDIMEDHAGNIWLAGNGGIAKYDGKGFENFNSESGLPLNFISCIAEDSTHRIWMGSNKGGGLVSFDGRRFTKYSENDKLYSGKTNCLSVLKNNEIWVGQEKGITILTNGRCVLLNENSGLPSSDLRDIFLDELNQIWIGTRSGISKFKGNLFNHYTNNNGIMADVVYTIAHDKDSSYWIGTGSGLSKFDGHGIRSFEPSQKLSINDSRSVASTSNGVTWFGSNSGLFAHYAGKFSIIDKNIGFQISFGKGVDTKTIFKVFRDNSDNLWIGTKHGVTKYDLHSLTNYNAQELGFATVATSPDQITAQNFISMCRVYDINQDKEGNLWFAIWGYGMIKYDGISFTHFNSSNGFPSKHLQSMAIDNQSNLWIGTENGLVLMRYDSIRVYDESGGLSNSNIQALQIDHNGVLWVGTRNGLNRIAINDISDFKTNPSLEKYILKKYYFDDGMISIGVSRNSLLYDNKGNLWMGGNNSLSIHIPEKITPISKLSVTLTSLDLFNDRIGWGDFVNKKDSTATLSNGMTMSGCEFDSVSLWYQLPLNASFKYNNNFLTFNFVGATTYQPEQVKYQYMLEGWDESWSGISSRTSAPYGNLPPGDYTFMVKAMNSSGIWSEPLTYSFRIRPPWFWNIWSKIAYLLFTVTGIFAIFRWRTGELRKRQRELEDTVRERTSEIAKKHREITDSINYAERIQRSLMASRQLLDANLPEYFVYFNPKERVSGDFFWACNLPNGKFALTCADSTGHGVPGAIMSMLNIAALERAVDGEGLTEPNLILDSARKKVIKTLAQDGSEEGGRDGMDAVLVSLDMKEMKMVAALANMQVWIMGSGEKRTIAPDKMPIGKHDKQDTPFTRHELQLKKGDVVYMFSDGYVDQFGGPNGKKFKYRPFEELLFSIHQLPLKEQQVIIRMHFENWMGDLEQVDDVCVIGIRM
jgi:ligand-binding sensor domain-containing protein/serine phosphatase RsbU (regulator of sigma subunit)